MAKDRVAGNPSVLPKRHKQGNRKYVAVGGYADTLDSVSVSISTTSTKPNTYTMPDADNEHSRRLRRYALILSRYQIVDRKKFLRKQGKSEPRVLDVTNRIVANRLYTDTYRDDPSLGTVFLDPLITSLSTKTPKAESLIQAMAYYGTTAIHTILTDKKVSNSSKELIEETIVRIDRAIGSPRSMSDAIRLYSNAEYSYDRESALSYYGLIYRALLRLEERVEEQKGVQEYREQVKADQEMYGKGSKLPPNAEYDEWDTPRLCKPELTISHSGLLGRKLRASREGKYVRDLSRIVTDTQQRIFGRKTKALGGVVVVDCSGSMSLTDEEMTSIMKASSGCTVIGYSSGHRDTPNIWLLARRGRQVRTMPIFPGNNGVDFPALHYGNSHRRGNAPMIWISDTKVTGRHSGTTEKLRNQCLRFCRKENVYLRRTANTACELLSRLQRGDKVINDIHTVI